MNFEYYKRKLVKKKKDKLKIYSIEFYIGDAYADFKEADITFPPTYKYDLRVDNGYAKHRTPSYTVKVLTLYIRFNIFII